MNNLEQKKEFNIKQDIIKKCIPIGIVILSLLFFFWKTRYSIFGAHEEYGLFYLIQKGDFFLWMNNVSKETGRITFYILSWFWGGPMFVDSPMFYRIVLAALVLIDVLVFYRLMYVHVNKKFALFSALAVVMTFQISNQHNLLISYSYLHVAFIVLVLSTHLLLDYCKEKKGYWTVVVSALLSFFASFFQENFVLFYVLSFLIVYIYHEEKHLVKRFFLSLWELRFHVLGGILFLTIYFCYRQYCGGGTYEGNSMCLTAPLTSLNVLTTFVFGMVPGRTFFELAENIGSDQILIHLSKKDIVIILLEVVSVSVLLYRSEKVKSWKKVIGLSAVASVLACLLHSVSVQYISWVSMGNTYAYVPSYYCCFFVNTSIFLLVNQFYHSFKGKFKYVMLGVFGISMAAFTVMSVSVNNYYTDIYREKHFHYEAYREYFHECDVLEWPEESQVLIVDAYDVDATAIKQSMTTVRYDALFFTITKDKNQIDQTKPYYIIEYGEDGQLSTKYMNMK